MKQSLIKIISLLLIIGLNWTGLSAIGKTLANFNDKEISFGNIFGATSLDFQLDSPRDFFPPSPDEPNRLIREIKIINRGNLNFKYQIRIGNYSGQLCENLKLSANLNNGEIKCATSSLTSFYCGPFEVSNDIENWQFVASFSGGNPLPQSCRFNLIFDAWQNNFSIFSGGFFDQEEIENKITKHYSEILPELSIVINEFLPNPVGPDDAKKPGGEWVELYNKGRFSVPLKGWFLMDLQGKKLPIPNSIIPPGGFLVVYLDGKYSPGWLNNSGRDGVSLWAPRNPRIPPKRCFGGYCIIDAHIYRGVGVLEGKSFARIPDGSKNWFDPIPTPASANKLSVQEKASLQPETTELSQEQLFQMFIEQFPKEPVFEINEKPSLKEPLLKNEPSENESINEDVSTTTEALIQQSNSTDKENFTNNATSSKAKNTEPKSTEAKSTKATTETKSTEPKNTETENTKATTTEATSTQDATFEEVSFNPKTLDLEISDQTTSEDILETSTSSEMSITDLQSTTTTEVTIAKTAEATTTEAKSCETTSTEEMIISQEMIFLAETTTTQEGEKTTTPTTTENETTTTNNETENINENELNENELNTNETTTESNEINQDEKTNDVGENTDEAKIEGILPKPEPLNSTSTNETFKSDNNNENSEIKSENVESLTESNESTESNEKAKEITNETKENNEL